MKHCVLALFLLSSLGALKAQQACFQPAIPVWVGSYPQALVSGDMNEDGNLDIISTSYTMNMVSIRVGTGTGAFNSLSGYFPTDAKPRGITIGDFNEDGHLDIATSNHDGNTISVMLGTGTASLSAAVSYSIGSTPMAITHADFDGDGHEDLAVVKAGPGKVCILMGSGTGTFGTPTNISLGGTANPYWIISADFNNDGNADLATANNLSNSVGVLLGTGSGNFSAVSHYTTSVWPTALVADDFNGDGNLDIVTANMGTGMGAASIFMGSGSGTFGAAVDFDPGPNPYFVTSSDLNSDGFRDLIFADYYSDTNNVAIFYGNGTGIFSVADDTLSGDMDPICVISDDFTNDGHPDIITSNYNDGMNGISDISVFVNCSSNSGTPGSPTGIKNWDSQESIGLSPNPSTGLFSLHTLNADLKEIRVYNTLGMLVYQATAESATQHTINLSDKANGVYTLVATTGRGNFTRKLVKE